MDGNAAASRSNQALMDARDARALRAHELTSNRDDTVAVTISPRNYCANILEEEQNIRLEILLRQNTIPSTGLDLSLRSTVREQNWVVACQGSVFEDILGFLNSWRRSPGKHKYVVIELSYTGSTIIRTMVSMMMCIYNHAKRVRSLEARGK